VLGPTGPGRVAGGGGVEGGGVGPPDRAGGGRRRVVEPDAGAVRHVDGEVGAGVRRGRGRVRGGRVERLGDARRRRGDAGVRIIRRHVAVPVGTVGVVAGVVWGVAVEPVPVVGVVVAGAACPLARRRHPTPANPPADPR